MARVALRGRSDAMAKALTALDRAARTGQGALVVISGEPGIGLEIAKWVVEKDLCLTGGDTWGVDVVPFPDKLAFACHTELQTKHGIYNHENLVFDGLIADKKYQFVYVFSPVPITGATGSPGGPIAIT